MTQNNGTPIFKAFSTKWIVLLMDWSWFLALKVFSPPTADCTGIQIGSVVFKARNKGFIIDINKIVWERKCLDNVRVLSRCSTYYVLVTNK